MSVPTVTLTNGAITGVLLDDTHLRALMAAPLPSTVKLGAIVKDAPPEQALRLANYLAEFAAQLPPSSDWSPKAMPSISRMYLNDQYGDCVIADVYHQVGLWTGNDTDQCVTVQDSEVLATYNRWKAGPGDSGCVISDVLDNWVRQGAPVNGVPHKLDGYLAIDPKNPDHYKVGVIAFGSVRLGIDLPRDWTNSDVWDVTNSRSVGGHDVGVVKYDDKGIYVMSWGRLYLITWRAVQSGRYITEAYVQLSPDWYNADKLAPNGITLDKLKADLDAWKRGQLPDVGPVDPPPPPGLKTYTCTVQASAPPVWTEAKAEPQIGFYSPSPAYGLTPEQWQQIIALVLQLIALFQQK
jgi:hypothetical protein